jgi:hypothetical protein
MVLKAVAEHLAIVPGLVPIDAVADTGHLGVAATIWLPGYPSLDDFLAWSASINGDQAYCARLFPGRESLTVSVTGAIDDFDVAVFADLKVAATIHLDAVFMPIDDLVSAVKKML